MNAQLMLGLCEVFFSDTQHPEQLETADISETSYNSAKHLTILQKLSPNELGDMLFSFSA